MMIRPIEYEREDTCPICKSKRSIEAYTTYDKPIDLTLAIDVGRDISSMGIKYLKCRKCKRKFLPNWITAYPMPTTEQNMEEFLNGYKQSFIKAESTNNR